MFRFIATRILLLLFSGGYALQTLRHHVNSLPNATALEDGANRFDILLKQAEFHVLKPGKVKKAIGSDAANISMAQGFKSPDAPVCLLKTKSLLPGESGQRPDTLLKQIARIQQVSLDQPTRVRNETIGAILFLLACGGMLYREYRIHRKVSRLVTKKNEIITEKNELLKRAIQEKEWLLKEVHHRIRNNLHTIVSLLESQLIFLENDAYKALEDSRNRIYAISLIHRQLYRAEHIETINMPIYLSEFVGNLKQNMGPVKIHFNLDVAAVELSISQAIPLALIINEAITNSIKYAFPDGRNGEIIVKILNHDCMLQLIVADNGVGINIALFDMELSSLGIKLIKGLTLDVNGKLKVKSSGKGTKLTIEFEMKQVLS